MSACFITLHATGKKLSCDNKKQPSLLTALEAHNLPVEYQCREGYCGSCRLKLVTGTVCYRREPLAFIRKDEILPCCCQPQGDIEIAIPTEDDPRP